MDSATPLDLQRKNRELYDDTFGIVWKQAIFDGLHGGHEFINLGGEPLIRTIGSAAMLTPGSRVLELCCGPGAVAAHLARLYGCRVTGLDINANQIAHARAMQRGLDRDLAARLSFVEADACAWSSPARYDVVVSIDAFMLLADPAAAFRGAARSVIAGGSVFVVTLAAGARLTRDFRRFASEIDGMVSLEPAAAYTRMCAAAALTSSVRNITPLAVRSSEKMLHALRRARRAIEDTHGARAYEGWMRVSRAYLDAFVHDQLRYLLVAGRRPVH